MSSQNHFHTAPNFNCITQFFHSLSRKKDLGSVRKFHAHLLRTGFLFLTPNLQTELIFAYTACLHRNSLPTLSSFLHCINHTNPLPFNAIISCFHRSGFAFLTLRTFSFMHGNGVPIDSYALCSSLSASSYTKDVRFGKQLHAHVEKTGWLSNVFVGSALVDLYARSLLIKEASVVFDEIPLKNTVCANALLSGYREAKLWVDGLRLVRKMPRLNLNCDNFTFTAIVRACVGLSAIEFGKQVHGRMIRFVPDAGADVFLQSSLIELYGKCGLVEKARQVFNVAGFGHIGERKRDVVLWTSMFGVYGRNGHFEEVIKLYEEMLMEGTRPDGVAFVTVISACGHNGQVNQGIEYFKSMARDFGLDPGPEHYSCLVDLLCRAGELEKAWKLVNEMPFIENGTCSVSMWSAVLSACIDCGNIALGKLAAHRALELDPQNDGIYVLLSNMYGKCGMWDEIRQLRQLMKERGLSKDIGCSWIEVAR